MALSRGMRAKRPAEKDSQIRLVQRVEDLEVRVRLLEAHVRELKAQARLDKGAVSAPKPRARATRIRPQPRCPGCLLELPRGRPRGETCVWCGFMFSAVDGRPFR
ncbi:MAG: hypothetical protein WBV82_26915 [Myxococcaceae bacterium]